MTKKTFWQTKLDAWAHDPGEKALILMRGKSHEAGTVSAVRQALGIDREGEYTRRADWWAASADRLQWPKGWDDRVHWHKQPELVHALSAQTLNLKDSVGDFSDTEVEDIEQRASVHALDLISRAGDDDRLRYLALWRFEPMLREENDNSKVGKLWEVLPADSRTPDHTIWDHKDLTAAVAGAMAADPSGEVALLAMTLGPVQPFIAAARSTTDLWSGSHLLSRLSWEMMRPLVESLGPDAVIFPRLRGVPQVDVWLQDQLGEAFADLFGDLDWKKRGATNANPLFAAALPNRFVALVPASQAEELAERCEQAVRNWLHMISLEVMDRLLLEANIEPDNDLYCYEQMSRQLKGFPEVHWASVSFGLIDTDENLRVKSCAALEKVAEPFWTEAGVSFLKSDYWRLLTKQLGGEHDFFAPRPSTLYPVVYELLERLLAAVKTIRPFEQVEEKGWRCSLTGETEWLTHDPELLTEYRPKDSLWEKIARSRPAWAKKGEHLSALPAIKRVWPDIFSEEVVQALGEEKDKAARFVVSTHVMANAKALEWLLHEETPASLPEAVRERLKLDATGESRLGRYALPYRIARKVGQEQMRIASAVLDVLEISEDEQAKKAVHKLLSRDGERPETYYALLMLDGDEMGAWLAGDKTSPYKNYFHSRIRSQFEQAEGVLKELGEAQRPVTPAYHMSISGALNQFALRIAPAIVQQAHAGQLIYAGGDDVLAMLPAEDAVIVASHLKQAYRGEEGFSLQDKGIDLKGSNGFVWLQGQLLPAMGVKATVSAGIVITHHKTPLGWVLRQVRAAEAAAKEAGRDRLTITLIKRAGGITRLTLKWSEVPGFEKLRSLLADESVSRRAAYNLNMWLKDMPDDDQALAALIAFQLNRQGIGEKDAGEMAVWLVSAAAERQDSHTWLRDVLVVAEFMARDTRSGGE